MNMRRWCTNGALATTLVAGSLSLSACTQESVAGQSADTSPSRVASAMQTPAEAAAPVDQGSLHNASQKSTQTAQGFMEYLEPGQREQLLGTGLDLGELTWAQQATALKLLESLFDEQSYETAANILQQVIHNDAGDGSQHHTLRFTAEPREGAPWEVIMEGPLLGFVAGVDDSSGIRIASAHLTLDPSTFSDTSAEFSASRAAADVNETAETLLASLTPEQIERLTVPEGSARQGLKGADLDGPQKDLLLEVATNWITVADEGTAEEKRAEISRTLDETYFAWTGTTGEDLAFRVNGPAIYLDYSADSGTGPEGTGARIHSEFRDPGLSS